MKIHAFDLKRHLGRSFAVALLAAALGAGVPACKSKKATPQAGAPSGQPGASASAARSEVQEILELIPEGSRTVAVVLSWRKLHGLLADLEQTMGRVPFGHDLVSRIRQFSGSAPIPLPLGNLELTALGLDPSRPLAIFGKESPLMLFSVSDPQQLRQRLAEAWSPGEQVQWEERSQEGVAMQVLPASRPLACMALDRYTLCSPDRSALARASARRPERSLWDRLSAEEKDALDATTLVLGGAGDKLSGLAMVVAEQDGLSARLRLRGPALSRITALMGGKGKGLLADRAADAPTRVYLRLEVGVVLNLLRTLLPDLGKLGLDPIRLQAGLSGELLVTEDAQQKVRLVLGCHDPSLSRELVETAARVLGPQSGKPGPVPSLKVTSLGHAKAPRYRLELASPIPSLPLSPGADLCPAPEGVVLGDCSQQAPAPVAASAPAERPTEQDELVLKASFPLGDPLAGLDRQLEGLMVAAELPVELVEGANLARFLLAQLHHQSLLVRRLDGQTLLLDLRLATLHRGKAEAGDDAARDLWVRSLLAARKGDQPAAEAARKQLVAGHPASRFARGAVQKSSALGQVLAMVLTSTALPAYMQYNRRAQLSEVHTMLARMAMAGRYSFDSPGVGKGGKPLPPVFPESTEWTPDTPCCQVGGQCRPAPGDWVHSTWTKLNFRLTEPFRFQYRFVSKGNRFSAQARGDITCKGIPKVYAIEGTLAKDGTVDLSALREITQAKDTAERPSK